MLRKDCSIYNYKTQGTRLILYPFVPIIRVINSRGQQGVVDVAMDVEQSRVKVQGKVEISDVISALEDEGFFVSVVA